MQLKKNFQLLALFILSMVLFSCEDQESGVDLVGFEARFISDIDQFTVTFNNISTGAESYMWDFGDNTSSNLENPVKTFENGTYTVILTAFDGNGNSSTFEQVFVIDVLVCVDETTDNINPANGDLNWTFFTQNDDTTFDAFGGTTGFITDNPVLDEVNNSCNVQIFVKDSGCQTFAGLGVALNTPIDFTDPNTNKIFKLKVLAENQLTEVTLRLEFQPFPNVDPAIERVASITELGEWQELTFDFSDVNTSTYSSLIIYFDRNQPCDGDVYYFDDLIQE